MPVPAPRGRPKLTADHLGSRDIPLLIEEIKETFLFFDPRFGDLLRLATFFPTAGHFRPGDIALLINEVEETLFAFHSNLSDFLCHLFHHLSFDGLPTQI
jgi:hypothetical protein